MIVYDFNIMGIVIFPLSRGYRELLLTILEDMDIRHAYGLDLNYETNSNY